MSEPTTPTPRIKRAHFEDTPPEYNDKLQRTNTAPSTLQASSAQKPNKLWGPARNYHRGSVSSIGGSDQGEDANIEPEDNDDAAEEVSLRTQDSEDDDPEFYDMELDEAQELLHDDRAEGRADSASRGDPDDSTYPTLYQSSSMRPRHRSDTSTIQYLHRVSDTLERSSSTSALHSATHSLLSPHKTLANVSTAHINVQVRLAHDASTDDIQDLLRIPNSGLVLPVVMSQPSQNPFRIAWEDVSDQESGFQSAASSITGDKIDKTKDKLVAWSWARKSDDLGTFSASPPDGRRGKESVSNSGSDAFDDNDDPPTPPNSRKPSDVTITHSTTRSPPKSPGSTLEPQHAHHVGKVHSHNHYTPSSGYLHQNWAPPISDLSRQLSTLAEEEKYLKIHRDSLDLARERLEEEKHHKPNPYLCSAKDSMIISKQRFERYPRSQIAVESRTGIVKIGGLSPILDASPPDALAQIHAMASQKRSAHQESSSVEVAGHSAGDHSCPICEIERPRSSRLEWEDREW